jgi:hypothetical protein
VNLDSILRIIARPSRETEAHNSAVRRRIVLETRSGAYNATAVLHAGVRLSSDRQAIAAPNRIDRMKAMKADA